MHRLQCIVMVQSFMRLLKLHKLVIGKLNLSRMDGLNLHRNIKIPSNSSSEMISSVVQP